MKKRILAITSVFENSTPQLQYAYCEALGDGRGYTFGYCGFTTATGDGLELVRALEAERLNGYLPRLEQLAKDEDGSTVGLDAFCESWREVGSSAEGIRAQHKVGEALYWKPAVKYAKELAWKSPLSLACLYDAIIQHGEGDDFDSLGSMLKRTRMTNNERQSVAAFLRVRARVLAHAHDPSTREQWRATKSRTDALKNLVTADNWSLAWPIQIASRDFNCAINPTAVA